MYKKYYVVGSGGRRLRRLSLRPHCRQAPHQSISPTRTHRNMFLYRCITNARAHTQTHTHTHTARELPVLFSPGFRTLRSRPCSSLPLLPCLQVDCQSQKLLGAEDRKRRRFSFSRCSPLAGSVLSLLPLVMSKDSSVSNL